ncbi:MAG: hypothetical protein KIT10_08065 [Flavobacteriales bacterium]|nr:hypothetical protein [Flavobacteriales bacterium]
MIRRLLPVLCIVHALAGLAQGPYGNEWIDHTRQYWRFSVVADGIMRIDSAALAQSGFPVATVDPRHLMLFSREQQVPIYVEGEADGEFNSSDFIEFRAMKNDAWIDVRLFQNPAWLFNPTYSFFNDTIRYFLTWDPDAEKKRIVNYVNTDFASYTPRTWYVGEAFFSQHGRYRAGAFVENSGAAVSSGFYSEAEGYTHTTDLVAPGAPEQTVGMATPQPYLGADAPAPQVTIVAVGVNNPGSAQSDDHHLQIRYGPAPGELALDTIYRGFKAIRKTFEIPVAAMSSSIAIRYRVLNDLTAPGQIGYTNPGYIDRQAVSNTTIRYAKNIHMHSSNSMRAWLPKQPGEDIVFFQFHSWAGVPIMYAYGDTVRRIIPTFQSNFWRTLIPMHPSEPETQGYIFAQGLITNVAALEPVNGTGYFTDYRTLEQDSAMIIVTHESLMSGALEYAHYRENLAYTVDVDRRMPVVVVEIDELYDQFAGGVPKHGLAIRAFSKYVLDQWSTDPRALFLIGKSVQAPHINAGSQGYRPAFGDAYQRCLVPGFGWPVSDPCITIGLRGDFRRMEIPVGRLSAETPAQVLAYRDKVAALEAQPRAAWMKNILHFAGGVNAAESVLHQNLLNGFKAIAEDTCFGGDVTTFKKTSSDVFQQAAADSVRAKIEEGVTVMTFIAHAFANGFDITIDDPSNYDWGGRHPLVIGNSCYIGNIHMNDNFSNSEQWTLMPGHGPIAFLASVDVGYTLYLSQYTNHFYRSFSQLNYGKSIGEHMRHAGFTQLSEAMDIVRQNNVHTFTLQGDPTLVLNSWPLPDYHIELQDVIFDPAYVTAEVDTFAVKAVVHNIGKAVNGPINVVLERSAPELPNVPPYFRQLDNVYLRDTAVFHLPSLGFSGGQGLNQIQVRVDRDPDEVPEMEDLANNVVNTSVYISSGDLIPVYPYDFAIVPDANPVLKASTGDPLAAPRTYVFQIDTTDLFNSPMLETTTITAPGGVVSWQPLQIYGLNSLQDSTVFFWRCSRDSTAAEGYNWYERSFQYIPNKHGWGQAHYFQFKNDTYNGVVYDRPNRRFEFETGNRNLQCYVAGNTINEASYQTRWVLDLVPQDFSSGCSNSPAWHVAVVDPMFEPWGTFWNGQNPEHQYGNQNNGTACRNRVELFFSFRTNSADQLIGMADMLRNHIPDGHHVLVYTWRYMDKFATANNNADVLTAMEELGVPGFAQLPDSVPFIFYVQKGDLSSFQQVVGTHIDDYISLSVLLEGLTDQGTITTMKAGPASSWYGLYWNEVPGNVEDSTRIVLRGVTDQGVEVELGNWPSQLDSIPDLSGIADAAQYPYLRIRGIFHDLSPDDQEPAQMQRWQLLGAPVPECAIHPGAGFYNGLNDLFQGQEAALAVAIQNISQFDMDSMLVGAWVIDRNNVRHGIHYKLNAPLPAGAVLMDTVRFSTMGLGGINSLIVEANPVDSLTGQYHQREQYRFNNILQIGFEVDIDRENPILDVTFDGIHIMDGDIVSAKPEIQVTLNDENPVLLLDQPTDTIHFKVFLAGPGLPLQRIYFRNSDGSENMQFIPADGPNNVSKIHYRPSFGSDGKYTMTVQAQDKSSNQSGQYDYKVSFEVINRPTITEVLNYPNPFTTSTRFVFTVTGSEPPSYMKIQILTVTGRVVREVRMHELGPIRVGRNITEFAWDGTDEFGDRLARGVYLYRVIAQLNGQEIEYRQTGASDYFHKGFGKMYLLR